jgi:hypothetical protein
VEVLKPGCGGIPSFDYIAKVQFTLLLMLLAAILFFLACILRLCRRIRASIEDNDDNGIGANENPDHHLLDEDAAAQLTTGHGGHHSNHSIHTHQKHVFAGVFSTPAFLDFRQRCVHAFLILLSVFYLRVSTLMMKAFVCELVPNPQAATDSKAILTESYYLSEDEQTKCYTDAHLSLCVGAGILLGIYTIGFPLFIFRILMPAFTDDTTGGLLGAIRTRFSCLRGKKKVSLQAVLARRSIMH